MKDFEVVKKIGQGSYGTVYKVKRKRDGQMLVIKQIEMGKATRKDQKEAENEVQILKSLKHRYVVKYIDSFLENKKLNIVMEHCSGGDLGKVIKLNHGGLEEKRVWKYLLQMLFGLRYIHSRKVLHRDMKTINVFLTENDEVRIGDLGVAKIAQDQSMFAQTIVGTPYYLSPELCEERPYNEKSDVWALGCIVYELCTKNHPFKATNQGALALKIIKGMYSPIPSTYSADLSQAIGLMLTKDYWKRPTTGQLLGMAIFESKMKTLGVEDDTQASAVGIDNLLNWTDKHDGNRQSGKSTKPADRQADKHRPESKAVRRPAGVGPQHVDIDQQRDSRIDDIALPPRPALFSAQRQKNTKLTTPGGTKDAKKNELTNIFSKPQEKQSMRKSESKEKPITLVKNTPSKSKQSSINNSKNDEQKIPNDIENQNIAQVFQLQSVRGIGSQEHKSYSEQRAMFKPIIQTEAVLLMQDKPKADGGHKSTVTTSKLPSIGNRPSHVRGSVPARDKSTVMQEGVKVSITHAGIARLTSAKPVANQKVFLDHGQVKVHDREKLGELQRPARTPSALTKHHFRKPEFRPPSVRKQSAVKHRSFNKSAKNDGVKLRERDREIQMVLDLPDDSSSSEENVRIKTLTAKRIPPIASLQQEEIGNIRYVSAMKPEVIVKPSKHGVGAKNLANKASLKKIVLEVTQEIEMSPGGSEDHQNLAENDQAYNSKSELVNQITFEVAEKDKGVEKLPRLTQHLQSYKQAKPAMAIKFTQEESPIRSRNTDSFLSNTDKRLKPGIKSILGTPLDPSPSKVPVDQQQAFPFDMEYDDIDQEGIALMSPSSRAKLALSRDLKMERSIDASVNSLYSALIKAFTQVILNSMLDFLGSVIEREDEPKEEDLAKFESLFRSDLSKAQPKDIVGVYKVLHLKVELKKCKDRIKESMAAIKV